MTEQHAFLSLARRLGNPIADRPEAIAVVEIFELVRGLRSTRRRDRLVRATLGRLPWVRTVRTEPSTQTETA